VKRVISNNMNSKLIKKILLIFFQVPGLAGGKMSSSEEESKIDILDPPEAVKRKLKKAFCEPGNIEDNGLLSFAEYVIFPIFGEFKLERKEAFGGPVLFDSIDKLKEEFKTQVMYYEIEIIT